MSLTGDRRRRAMHALKIAFSGEKDYPTAA
jgi:hypothetical protein